MTNIEWACWRAKKGKKGESKKVYCEMPEELAKFLVDAIEEGYDSAMVSCRIKRRDT